MRTGLTSATPLMRPPIIRSPMEDPLRLFPRIFTKLYSLWVGLMYPFASLGRKVSIHPTCDWRRSRVHRIKIGSSVQIRKDAVIDVAAPAAHKGEPIIVIDDNTCLGPQCHISARNCIHIEHDVLVGQSVLISDHDCGDENGRARASEQCTGSGGRVRIGQGSWIGYRAAIICTSGELVLGRNCVVGANAVITRSFPPYSVIFGNPARVIRQFDPLRNAWVLKSFYSKQ
jgi:acetyltransferase-like isoleucine patch superfamily enzyme